MEKNEETRRKNREFEEILSKAKPKTVKPPSSAVTTLSDI